MNVKKNRQALILQIIRENKVATQEELTEKLASYGVNVTQATISRDLRELGLSKASGKRGNVGYTASEESLPENKDSAKFRRIFRDAFVSAAPAGSLLVVKTASGMAMAVGAALDSMGFEELVGCICGDDTIFIATQSALQVESLKEKLLKIIQ